jgi:hypothetical protein
MLLPRFALAVAVSALVVASTPSFAQKATAPPDMAAVQKLVTQEFGDCFKAEPIAGPSSVLLADFDGDGMEDLVVQARCKTPLLFQADFRYQVIDPYDAFWGMSNPRITSTFSTHDADQDRVLLVVHSWRTPTPKAKFAIINLPFDEVGLFTVVHKKKARAAIQTTEAQLMKAQVYWDGKRYKYVPGDTLE